MTQMQQEQLTRIYNTLMLISTRGEDTLIMSDCLRAIQQLAEEPVMDESISMVIEGE